MDLGILLLKPKLDKKIKLIIEPLAPLSMVSDLPGTYYKNHDVPDIFKICGLFENVLGWHFDKKDRNSILKYLKKHYKKNLNENDFDIERSNSKYQPLLINYFEMGMVFKFESFNYDDLWKRCFSRMDADVHPKGTINLDYETLKEKVWIKEEEKLQEKIKEEIKALDSKLDKEKIAELKEETKKTPLLKFFEENKKSYPMYYTSPTLREYTDYLGSNIQISLMIDDRLLEMLKDALNICATAYLGNSEGWIEMKIEVL